jgi:N-methylhydantoinase A
MIRAVKTVSTYRGHDPRECTLIAFGGNGPIVALAIAADMGIKRVIVPPNSGLLSASGLLWADPEREVARAFQGALTKLTTASIEAELSALVDDVAAMLLEDGYTLNTISFQRQLDMRYSGQAFELSVSVNNKIPDTTNLETAFHRRYQQAYGHSLDSHPVELVNIRVIASVQRLPGSEYHSFTACHTKTTEARACERDVYFGPHFGSLSTPVITRNNLDGTSQKGPLIIEEYDATCVIPPNCVVQLDDADNVIIDRAS